MTFLTRSTPAVSVAIFVSILFFVTSECDGLKKPRSFAHLYGKRASPAAYNFGGQKKSNFPMFSRGDFSVDYEPSDESILLRREDAKVNAKANVGHMFGRDLYDNYPLYDIDNMYTVPDMEENNIEMPNIRDDELFNIQSVSADEPHNLRERKRQLILDLLKSSPAARMEALSYLNEIRNNRQSAK